MRSPGLGDWALRSGPPVGKPRNQADRAGIGIAKRVHPSGEEDVGPWLSTTKRKAQDFQDFFSAAEARTDRWRQMSAAGRAWESATTRGQAGEEPYAEATRLLGEIAALEDYWAYPGSRLMATVAEAAQHRNAAVFVRLVQKISQALLTGGYRHDSAAWDPLDDGEGRSLDTLLPPDTQQGGAQALLRGPGGDAQ